VNPSPIQHLSQPLGIFEAKQFSEKFKHKMKAKADCVCARIIIIAEKCNQVTKIKTPKESFTDRPESRLNGVW
jgi:hypothetical protein